MVAFSLTHTRNANSNANFTKKTLKRHKWSWKTSSTKQSAQKNKNQKYIFNYCFWRKNKHLEKLDVKKFDLDLVFTKMAPKSNSCKNQCSSHSCCQLVLFVWLVKINCSNNNDKNYQNPLTVLCFWLANGI